MISNILELRYFTWAIDRIERLIVQIQMTVSNSESCFQNLKYRRDKLDDISNVISERKKHFLIFSFFILVRMSVVMSEVFNYLGKQIA